MTMAGMPALGIAFWAFWALVWQGQGAPGSPARFDSSRAYEHMRQMVAIGPRPAGSAAIEETRKYIKSQLTAMGLLATEQAFDAKTPAGTVHMVNLLVTIP